MQQDWQHLKMEWKKVWQNICKLSFRCVMFITRTFLALKSKYKESIPFKWIKLWHLVMIWSSFHSFKNRIPDDKLDLFRPLFPKNWRRALLMGQVVLTVIEDIFPTWKIFQWTTEGCLAENPLRRWAKVILAHCASHRIQWASCYRFRSKLLSLATI